VTQQGWYRDPQGEGERWHDGTRWTGVTRPTAESIAVVAAAEATVARRERRVEKGHRLRTMSVVVLILLVILGLVALLAPGQIKPIERALGIGRPHRLLPAVTPAVQSSAYAITHTDFQGDPIAYDPCKPLRYVINPAGAPANYLSFVDPAIKAAQAATGLKFEYDGLTTDVASTREQATNSEPVLISFVGTIDKPVANAETVGLGGSTYETINGQRQPNYLTGSIELLRSFFARESAAHATAAEQSVVMHELGHVLGLGHVQDRNEVMYPAAHGQTAYGVGDLSGLARLGAGQCSD
jgi:hypothetical protein